MWKEKNKTAKTETLVKEAINELLKLEKNNAQLFMEKTREANPSMDFLEIGKINSFSEIL
jgi:hypothetical protein